MDIVIIITGLIMVGIGFIVKASPNLIAGYNTMPEHKKKNVNIEGLSIFMRNSLIVMGLSIIAGYYLFKWLGFIAIADSIIMIVVLLGVTIMVINARRFDHNKNKSKGLKYRYYVLGGVTVFVILLLTYGYIPSKAIITNETVRFTGMYGFEVNVSNIENVELVDVIPSIKMRNNGFSFGKVNKGFFNLDEFGKTRLLLHSNESPFLIISNKNEDKIIINYRDSLETDKIFDEIKILINK